MNVQLQCLLGLQCDQFTMLAADQINSQRILVMKADEEKLHPLSNSMIMGINGDAGETAQFSQFIAKNIQLYRLRNGYELDTAATVHFTRRNLADSLRSGSLYTINLLVAGYNENEGGELYYLDYLASCVKVPFAAHGFGGLLSMSILDRYHKPTLSMSEAYNVLKLCVHEVHERLFVNLPNFQVAAVSKKGIEKMPPINPESFRKQT